MPAPTADTSPPATGPGGVSRRTVLRAAAATGAGAALLAACGGDETTADPGSSGSSDTSPSPSGTSATSGEESPGGGGAALAATSEVPVGGGLILEAEKVVITQPVEGDFKAFTAVCTHQSCTVASVKGDKISCACHGSAYSAKDGSVLNGPATRPLKAIAISVEGDQVVQT